MQNKLNEQECVNSCAISGVRCYQEYEHKEKRNVGMSKHPNIRSEGLKYETTAFMNPS